jgi:hypothetical protein
LRNITLKGIATNTVPLVTVAGGHLVLEADAVIKDDTTTCVIPDGGYGILTYGGGVHVQSGTFTMNGGTISGNSVKSGTFGGGVFVEVTGAFTMNGGDISGNSAGGGGGVFVGFFNPLLTYTGSNTGTFMMNGGTISGNSATNPSGDAYLFNPGGGVYVDTDGMFTMTGSAVISGNTTIYNSNQGDADVFGGGVYVRRDGVFTKSGNSTIYGYSAGDSNSNKVVGTDGSSILANKGHAAYAKADSKQRNGMAAEGVDMRYRVSGQGDTGWE